MSQHLAAPERPKRASLIKVRFLITLMATLCPTVCYIARQNLSMAIVAMVKVPGEPAAAAHNATTTPSTNLSSALLSNEQAAASQGNLLGACPLPSVVGDDGRLEQAAQVISYGPKYDWTPSQSSFIFEAFFWTYVLFQIPGARLSEQMGAKWILFTAAAGSSLISLLSPLAASLSVYLLALLRALMGLCQAALYPSCYALYAHWLPPLERSKALPMLGVGTYFGSIITSTAAGYFSEQEQFGWEYAFYMPSCLCAVWSILWFFIATSEPRQHRFISLEEIEYIESRMEVRRPSFSELQQEGQLRQFQPAEKKNPSWMKIVKSQHVWAMCWACIASNWSFTIVLLLLPSYLNLILHISPFRNGLINSVIYILFCISSPIVGSVSTLMIETRPGALSRLQIRKIFESIALFGQAICFLLLPLLGCDTNLVLAALFAMIILYSFVNGGEVQLPSELSLDFSGTIYAIGNCIGSSTGFIIPRVHSWIVKHPRDRTEWNTYFYVAASVTALGGFIFLFFGRNDLQDYAKDEMKSLAPQRRPSNDYLQQTGNPQVDLFKPLGSTKLSKPIASVIEFPVEGKRNGKRRKSQPEVNNIS